MVLHSSQQGHCSSFASHLVRDEGCVQLQHFWRLWTHLFFICISLTEVRCCATSHWLICQLCVSRSEASLQLFCPVFNCFNLKLSFQSIWGNHSSRDTSFENVFCSLSFHSPVSALSSHSFSFPVSPDQAGLVVGFWPNWWQLLLPELCHF